MQFSFVFCSYSRLNFWDLNPKKPQNHQIFGVLETSFDSSTTTTLAGWFMSALICDFVRDLEFDNPHHEYQ